jgi:hypothetical protein
VTNAADVAHAANVAYTAGMEAANMAAGVAATGVAATGVAATMAAALRKRGLSAQQHGGCTKEYCGYAGSGESAHVTPPFRE